MSEQRPWRPILAIGGLLGLVGVVAFAAAGRSPGGVKADRVATRRRCSPTTSSRWKRSAWPL